MVGRNSRRNKKAIQDSQTPGQMASNAGDAAIVHSAEDLALGDDNAGAFDAIETLAAPTTQPSSIASISDHLLLSDWQGTSRLYPNDCDLLPMAIIDWGQLGTPTCLADRAQVSKSSGNADAAASNRQQQLEPQEEESHNDMDFNFETLHGNAGLHSDTTLLDHPSGLESPGASPGCCEGPSPITYSSVCSNSPATSTMGALPALRQDQTNTQLTSRLQHQHQHQHRHHDTPSLSLAEIANMDDGNVDQIEALSRIIHVLEAQQPSQAHHDRRLDELMRVIRTCTTAASDVLRRRQGFRWCATSKTMMLLILDLMLILFEYMVQVLAFEREMQHGHQGDDRAPSSIEGLPALQFGVLELEPAEQAVVARRVVCKDLQKLLDMFQKLSGCCDGSVRDGKPKMLCHWYRGIKSRLDHLLSVVKSRVPQEL